MDSIIDCCYSGSILNLPYEYDGNGNAKLIMCNTCKSKSWSDIFSFFFRPSRSIQKLDIGKPKIQEKSLTRADVRSIHKGKKKESQKLLTYIHKLDIGKKKESQPSLTDIHNGKKKESQPKILEKSLTEADVICFSACTDYQVSADTCFPGFGCYGAMTDSFLRALKSNRNMTYAQLLKKVQDSVKNTQTPTLSSNHLMNMSLPVVL